VASVVVAAYNHIAAHEDDKFFRKGCASDPIPGKDYEYSVVPSRAEAWRRRVIAAADELDAALHDDAVGGTVWIGH